jgi:DNA-binding FrmR family transcriptional regulator
MKPLPAEDVRTRLKKIDGQVKGLMRMIERERSSEEILVQVLAIRAALGSVGLLVISEHVDGLEGASDLPKQTKERLSTLVKSFLI